MEIAMSLFSRTMMLAIVGVLLTLLLLADAENSMAIGDPIRATLVHLKDALEKTANPKEIDRFCKALSKSVGTCTSISTSGPATWQIQLARPIDAKQLSQLWGWKRPYGVSGDVHQQHWQIRLFQQQLQDPYGPRIATIFPKFGALEIRTQLSDRPQGPLPKTSSGASPAYDLWKHPASVGKIEFVLLGNPGIGPKE